MNVMFTAVFELVSNVGRLPTHYYYCPKIHVNIGEVRTWIHNDEHGTKCDVRP